MIFRMKKIKKQIMIIPLIQKTDIKKAPIMGLLFF
jgi:hypothetical protein